MERKRRREEWTERTTKNKNNLIFSRGREQASLIQATTPSPPKKNPFSEIFQEVDMKARLEIMRKREFLNEKRFFYKVGNLPTFITNVIAKYTWKKLCAHSQEAMMSLVQEFYVGMGNGSLSIAMVRNRQ